MSLTDRDLETQLFALQDLKYRDFHCRLIPTVDPKTVIGVRTPALRRLAKEFAKTEDAAVFLETLPHRYYEENNLHGMLISAGRDYQQAVEALNRFLPFVDNWATCDLISPKAFKSHPTGLPEQARSWMGAEHTYMVRFGIGVLMGFYLDEAFRPEYLSWAAELRSEEYYINMMTAWFFATALAKQYDAALPYIEGERLELWVHNKTIQKAVESYRVSEDHKRYLRKLRRKRKV